MSPHRMFGAAFAVLVAATAAHAQEDDLPKFAGAWTVTAAKLGEDDATELVGATFVFDATTAKFTQKGEDGQPVTDTHPFKADPKTKRLVLYQAPTPEDPKPDPKNGMQRGIYTFKETTLYLCLTAPDATDFPAKFVAKNEETDYLLLRLERPKTAAVPSAPAPK